MSQGYKKTDVGFIPVDWGEPQSLNDVLSEMTDYVAAGSFESIRENVRVYDFDNYAYYIRLVDIRAGIGHPKQKFVDKKSYDFLKRSNLFGDEILIANIGANVGEVFIMPKVDKPATIAPNMILMRTNKSILDSKFCYYFIDSKAGQRLLSELIAGSGHPKLNKTDLKKLLVPIPPTLQEQNAIATALSDVDDLISSLDILIAKKKAIKQGAMQRLMIPPHKGGQRLPGFDGEWKELVFTEICELVHGYQFRTEDFNHNSEGIKVIKIGNVMPDKLITEGCDTIDSDRLKHFENYQLKKGDILMSLTGNIGRVVRLPEIHEPLLQNYRVGKFVPKMGIDPGYLSICLGSIRTTKQLEQLSNAAAQANFGKQDFDKVRVSIPKDIEEQKSIAKIISDISSEIKELEKKKKKYEAIKEGMMQELLSGKTRLV